MDYRTSAPTAPSNPMTGREAASYLADLTERQLELPKGTLNPVALRIFVAAYWGRLSMYAHAIHNDQERYSEQTVPYNRAERMGN